MDQELICKYDSLSIEQKNEVNHLINELYKQKQKNNVDLMEQILLENDEVFKRLADS